MFGRDKKWSDIYRFFSNNGQSKHLFLNEHVLKMSAKYEMDPCMLWSQHVRYMKQSLQFSTACTAGGGKGLA
jgi:hypothetical protein